MLFSTLAFQQYTFIRHRISVKLSWSAPTDVITLKNLMMCCTKCTLKRCVVLRPNFNKLTFEILESKKIVCREFTKTNAHKVQLREKEKKCI